MKLKLIITAFSALAIWTLFSFTEIKSTSTGSNILVDTNKSYLALYGEYIFNREKCNNCHSLNISENQYKISLDGLKGKYPQAWHYQHLIDPRSMVINSKMPSFATLAESTFNKEVIEKQVGNISEQDWNKLIAETETIKNELTVNEISSVSNTEIIALIKYLDNIPVSPEYDQILSKEHEQAIREKTFNDSIWKNTENNITSVIKNPGSISTGHEIYQTHCTPCHGQQGEGLIGPNLTDEYWLHGGKDQNLVNIITKGVPEKGMISWKNQFTPTQIGQVIAYIKSIKGTNPRNAKIQQGTKE